MAKLTVYQFNELTKEQQKSVADRLGAALGAGYTPDYLTKFPRNEVNVEVVLDEDGCSMTCEYSTRIISSTPRETSLPILAQTAGHIGCMIIMTPQDTTWTKSSMSSME